MMNERERKMRDCYLAAFGSDNGRMVLEHLMEFCRYSNSDFCADPRLADYLQGRRSVICRIMEMLKGDKE